MVSGSPFPLVENKNKSHAVKIIQEPPEEIEVKKVVDCVEGQESKVKPDKSHESCSRAAQAIRSELKTAGTQQVSTETGLFSSDVWCSYGPADLATTTAVACLDPA